MIRPLTLALLLALAAPPVAAKQAPAPDYTAALADPARPAADRDRDAARQPAELLAFAGVKPGQKVTRGSPLLSIEAMKMENAVSAERDGVIARVLVAPGDRVDAKDLLLEFEASNP